MDGLVQRILRLYASLERLEWLPRLAARIGVGLMFLGGAIHKAGNLGEFVEYFRSLGIPAPALQAPFVVAVELLGGLALMIGLATRPAAVMLAGTMVVALGTAAVPEHHIHANWKGLLDFLYLPEWLLLLLLAWLAVAGAGRASLDHGLRARFEKGRGEKGPG
jgi:putative oxidoreductase